MGFFHFRTLRKYTASLLDLFNDIEIEQELSNGKKINKKVPIQYIKQERAMIASQLSYDQIFSGNTQILPRMGLFFNSLTPARDRQKNKFVKLNINYNNKNYNYQFNSVPFDFSFTVIAQARGVNEASLILEQICSYFNPSYTLKIQEIPIPNVEYTSIVLDLENVSFEQQEADSSDEYTTNIVTMTFDLKLRGNVYPAIKDQETIKMIQLFMNTKKIKNVSKYDENKQDVINITNKVQIFNKDSLQIPEILNVVYNKEKHQLICYYKDFDSKLQNSKFYWYINNEELKTHERIIDYEIRKETSVSVKMIDDDGKESNLLTSLIFP